MDVSEWLAVGNKLEAEAQKLKDELEQAEVDLKKANKKTTPFEFITSIQEKRYMFEDKNAKHFVPHVVNMGLSQHVENIGYCFVASQLQASLSGLHAELSNNMIYDYLYHTIRKGKKFGKWAKVEKYDHLDLIMQTYKVTRDEAIRILNRLTPEELQQIVGWDDKKSGGISR